MYPTLKEYVRKDLEQRFYNANGVQFIEIIEQAMYYRFSSLAKQMIADLGDDEAALWRMHRRALQHEEQGEKMFEDQKENGLESWVESS